MFCILQIIWQKQGAVFLPPPFLLQHVADERLAFLLCESLCLFPFLLLFLPILIQEADKLYTLNVRQSTYIRD